MVPGLIIAFFGMVNWFFLVPNPQDVGIDKETVSYFFVSNMITFVQKGLSQVNIFIYLLTCFVRSLNWIRLNLLQTTFKV